jgi:hypothetical protein
MGQWIGIQAHGRLSLRKREGEGEGFAGPAAIEPLTFILSPCARGEAEKRKRRDVGKFPV